MSGIKGESSVEEKTKAWIYLCILALILQEVGDYLCWQAQVLGGPNFEVQLKLNISHATILVLLLEIQELLKLVVNTTC